MASKKILIMKNVEFEVFSPINMEISIMINANQGLKSRCSWKKAEGLVLL